MKVLNETLSASIEELKQEKTELAEKVSELETKNTSLCTSVEGFEELKQEKHALDDKISVLEAEKTSLSTSVERLEELQHERTILEGTISNLKEEKNCLAVSVDDLTATLENTIASSTEKEEELLNKLADMESMYAEKKEEDRMKIDNLTAQVSQVHNLIYFTFC